MANDPVLMGYLDREVSLSLTRIALFIPIHMMHKEYTNDTAHVPTHAPLRYPANSSVHTDMVPLLMVLSMITVTSQRAHKKTQNNSNIALQQINYSLITKSSLSTRNGFSMQPLAPPSTCTKKANVQPTILVFSKRFSCC